MQHLLSNMKLGYYHIVCCNPYCRTRKSAATNVALAPMTDNYPENRL